MTIEKYITLLVSLYSAKSSCCGEDIEDWKKAKECPKCKKKFNSISYTYAIHIKDILKRNRPDLELI